MKFIYKNILGTIIKRITMDYGLLKKYTREINLLFIEDDVNFRKEFADLLQDIFPFVSIAVDGEDGLKMYNEFFLKNGKYYDLIISDIRMPNLDGIQLIKEIYNINSKQAIAILSAKKDSSYLLPLINLGIEHFFTKPLKYDTFINDTFILSESIYKKNKRNKFIKVDKEYIFNKEERTLLKNNKKVKVTKKELLLIEKFLQNNGKLFPIEELIHIVWGKENMADTSNLKSLISKIRKRIPSLNIENIYGKGYKVFF